MLMIVKDNNSEEITILLHNYSQTIVSQDSSYIAGNSTHHLVIRTELTW